jgi:hypothetical protein
MALATDAAIHAPGRSAPTSHEDGGITCRRAFGELLWPDAGFLSQAILLIYNNNYRNPGVRTRQREAPSHDHGMESVAHFDEVLAAFNTNPSL